MFLSTMALFINVGMKAVKIIPTFLLYSLIAHIVYTAVSLSCDLSLLHHLSECLS